MERCRWSLRSGRRSSPGARQGAGKIGPGSAACVLVFDAHRFAASGRQTRMNAHASLNAGLLVRGHDEFVFAQRLSLPASRVQVQDAPGLDLEMRVTREDPAAMLPRAD